MQDENMQDSALQLPKRTTPTWEIELLISGATTYALTQVLGASSTWFLNLEITLNNAAYVMTLMPLQLYARIVLMCLVGAFLIHLAARAYWVGLIGLHSVFQGPPDLSKIKYGPLQKSAMLWNREDIPAHIESADNRATMIFGFGVGMALMMTTPIVLMLLSLGLSLILDIWLPTEKAIYIAFGVVLLPIFLIAVVPSIIDQALGERINTNSALAKIMRKTFSLLDRLSFNSSGNLLTMYLFTQARNHRMAMLSSALIGALLSFFALIGVPRAEQMSNAKGMSEEFELSDYASEREEQLQFYRRPYIASPQLRDDYLEINVPIPNKSPSGGHDSCSKDSEAKAFIDCMKRDLVLRIDDTAAEASWLLVKPRSGQPATLRALLDVRELPRGAHRLRIEYPFDRKHQKDAWVELIHFWK
jgi:hypothetical protein